MIKRDEIAGPSCLTSAADDEPIFVLRANDELAWNIVRMWAEKYYDTKIRKAPIDTSPDVIERRYKKYSEAHGLANAMVGWAWSRNGEVPNTPDIGGEAWDSALRTIADLRSRLSAATAALEAAQKDAGRYRWLLKNVTWHDTADQLPPVLSSVSSRLWYHVTDNMTQDLSEVIDAAMSGGRKT